MKLCCAVAVAVLVLSLCSQGESQFGPVVCCVIYLKGVIPAGKIKAYQLTSTSCLKPAVIFTTTTNKMLCVDPNDKWVKDIIYNMDNM